MTNRKLSYAVLAAGLLISSVPAMAATDTTTLQPTTTPQTPDKSNAAAAPNNPDSIRNDIPGVPAGSTVHGSDNSFPGQHVVGAPTTANTAK